MGAYVDVVAESLVVIQLFRCPLMHLRFPERESERVCVCEREGVRARERVCVCMREQEGGGGGERASREVVFKTLSVTRQHTSILALKTSLLT